MKAHELVKNHKTEADLTEAASNEVKVKNLYEDGAYTRYEFSDGSVLEITTGKRQAQVFDPRDGSYGWTNVYLAA